MLRPLRTAKSSAHPMPRSSTSTPESCRSRRSRGLVIGALHSALRHVPGAAGYNRSLRQLLHVGFKVAAKMGRRYLDLVETNEEVIAKM